MHLSCRVLLSRDVVPLGSIFDSARNDPTLYHFDNDLYDDDDQDAEYEREDEDEDEYDHEDEDGFDEDDPDGQAPDRPRHTSHAIERSHSSNETSEEDEEWQIDVDPLDPDKRR